MIDSISAVDNYTIRLVLEKINIVVYFNHTLDTDMATFLKFITNAFANEHKNNIVGIDVGSSSIKVVEIEKAGDRAVLRNYGEIYLGPLVGFETGKSAVLSPERLSEALNEILKATGITTKHASFAIPFSASLLTVAEFPDVGGKNIESMIPLEARKYIPVPIDEVTIDWWVLPKRKNESTAEPSKQEGVVLGKVEVILAAINNEVIKTYEIIKKNAQLSEEASHFEIEIFSTLRAVAGNDLAPIIVIDIGASGTKLAFVDDGIVRGSHVISSGGQDITESLSKSLSIPFQEAEDLKCRIGLLGDYEGRDIKSASSAYLFKMTNETKKIIENYERKYDTRIKKIILVGGGARLKGLVKEVEQNFQGINVTVGDSFSRVKAPAFLEPVLKELSPNFAVAVGVAFKALEE